MTVDTMWSVKSKSDAEGFFVESWVTFLTDYIVGLLKVEEVVALNF